MDKTQPNAVIWEPGGIAALLDAVVVSTAEGEAVELAAATASFIADARRAHEAGAKLIFVGVGADAGSASHMAIDFSKNGNVRALSFDAATVITCLGNDLGFDALFAKQLELHARAGDVAIIIGGCGTDPTLLNAAKAARKLGLKVVTTVASSEPRPLSELGDLNFRLPTDGSGIATIAQLALCHSWVDFLCGWQSEGVPHRCLAKPEIAD
jgi:D-sedoheptulose 7-phosphate isomerase